MRSFSSLFLDHPRSVDESYVEHAAFAGKFAGRLFLASCAAAVHAVVPCLFERTASRMIIDMHGKIAGRGQPAPEERVKMAAGPTRATS